MGFYSLTMLNIALELAKHNPVLADLAVVESHRVGNVQELMRCNSASA
jgi:hypothetical protein